MPPSKALRSDARLYPSASAVIGLCATCRNERPTVSTATSKSPHTEAGAILPDNGRDPVQLGNLHLDRHPFLLRRSRRQAVTRDRAVTARWRPPRSSKSAAIWISPRRVIPHDRNGGVRCNSVLDAVEPDAGLAQAFEQAERAFILGDLGVDPREAVIMGRIHDEGERSALLAVPRTTAHRDRTPNAARATTAYGGAAPPSAPCSWNARRGLEVSDNLSIWLARPNGQGPDRWMTSPPALGASRATVVPSLLYGQCGVGLAESRRESSGRLNPIVLA